MMKTYKVNAAAASAGREAAHYSSVGGGCGGGAQAIANALSLPPSVNFYGDGDSRSGVSVGGGLNSAGISMAKKFGKVVRNKETMVRSCPAADLQFIERR